MPSNRELIERAEGLGVELGIPVQTKGLNNAKLLALVEELEVRVAELADSPGITDATSADNSETEWTTDVAAQGATSAGTVQTSAADSPLGPVERAHAPSASSQVALSQGGGAVRRTQLDSAAASAEQSSATARGNGGEGRRGSAAATPSPQQPPTFPSDGVLAQPGATDGGDSSPHAMPGRLLSPYAVADGRSLVVHRGVLGPGAEVRLDDVAGGTAQLDELVAAGYLVRNGSDPRGIADESPARAKA